MMGVTHQQLMQITPFHLSRMSETQRGNLSLYYFQNIDIIGRQLCYKKLQEFINDQKRRLGNRNVIDYGREFDMIISGQIRPVVTSNYELNIQMLRQQSKKHKVYYRQLQLRFKEFKKFWQSRRELQKIPEEPTLYESIAAFISSIVSDRPELPKGLYSLQNVQKDRSQRSKPLKKGFFIRSRHPNKPSLSQILELH